MADLDPSRPPWQSLPADLAEVLAPVVPSVAELIIQTVPVQIPAYAVAPDGGYGRKIELGVRTALSELLSLPGTAQRTLRPETRELMASLGAGEFRVGRTMDALLSAYRMAARIAFRELSEECVRQGLSLDVVVDLGESIWAYIDELSAVTTQAYAEEQLARAGVSELRRSDLASALVLGTAGPEEVQRLSVTADWPLPELLTVVVVPLEHSASLRAVLGRPGQVLSRAGLVIERGEGAIAVVPAPHRPQVRRRMLDALAGTAAVVSPDVPWEQVPFAHRVARTLVERRAADDDAGGEPLLAEEHLGRVLLAAEPRVVEALAAQVLAPLDGLTEAKRAVLEQTLASWLEHWGQRARIARDLSIHPQTVGYRVGRLRELFGDALEDPRARFDLQLVLRARAESRAPGRRPHRGAALTTADGG